MVKKIFFLALATSLFGASDEEIISFYKQKLKNAIPDAEISVLSREKMNENYEKIVVNIAAFGENAKEVIFAHGNFLLPDIVDIQKGNFSYRDDFKSQNAQVVAKEFESKALEVLKTEDKIISIGDTSKPEIFVFSDPECPFCRKHLEGIEEILKKNRVHFVFVSVHDKSAFEKIALIYNEIKKTKNDTDKLSIIRKYYANNVVYNPPKEEDYKEAVALFEKYQKLGLKAVPTIIEKK